MAVNANTSETYDNSLIREDLQEAYNMISPEETPFQQMAAKKSASNTLFEWSIVELAATSATNRVIEGDDAPGVDAATLGLRLSNYTQISDKTASVSHTAQAVDAAAANVQRMGKQLVLKMKELKRDKEVMLLSNNAAAAGSSGSARTTAGLPAFLRTNTVTVAGGADPTLSGTTEGYPNAVATEGTTPVVFAEADMNTVIESCWNEGAVPSVIMCNGGNKRRISEAFTGNATRYKDTIDKKVVNSIDFYSSDFGELTVIPNRFQPTINPGTGADNFAVYILDPEYLTIAYLDEVQQKPLAETGHAIKSMVWCEFGLQVDNEAAHGVIRDTTNALT
jgi:hypothetical protein